MWFLYAVLGAFGKSYSAFFRKKVAGNISSSTYTWIGYTLALFILAAIMRSDLAVVPEILRSHFTVVVVAALSNNLGVSLNLAALKREDLSYIAPLNAFVPVFTLIIANVYLGESPRRFGVLGVFVVVIGAYIVSLRSMSGGVGAPIKRLVTNSGAKLSIGVAVSYAINTVLVKKLTTEGYNSFTSLFAVTLLGWLFLSYVPLFKRREIVGLSRADMKIVLLGGLASLAGSLFHTIAMTKTYASYATGVRRFDAIISIALGWRYLKESDIRYKLIGSVVMTVGTLLMLIS
jgi:drug/metabolite transporter (DMT)-like permease